MPCERCNGIVVDERFHDRVDEQGVLRLGAWRWASWCAVCQHMVEERPVAEAVPASRPAMRTASARRFMMF